METGLLLFMMLAGAASQFADKRILGGRSCGDDRQYHIRVEWLNGAAFCAGSLLNTKWVLTAAHCGQRQVTVKMKPYKKSGFVKKVKNLFLRKEDIISQEIPVAQQFPYNDNEGKPHDIMLIKLNPVASGNHPVINLPPIASCAKPEEGSEVGVGGWGAAPVAAKGAKASGSLKCSTTQVKACGEKDKPPEGYHCDETTTMCAFKPGVESCPGDAGAAVEFGGVMHGLVVSEPVDKCANPIVFLNICHYRQWIEDTMHANDA